MAGRYAAGVSPGWNTRRSSPNRIWPSGRSPTRRGRPVTRSNSQIRFGDDRRVFQPGETPAAYRPAIDAVRASFARERLRGAVEDVTTVTVFGTATCYHGIDYDWEALPAYLVTDIRTTDGLLGPDEMVRSSERLGLTPAPVVEKERRADAFDPASESFPDSAYADERAAGLDVADKRGTRGRLRNDAVPEPADPGFTDVEDAVESLLTDARAGQDVESTRDRIVRQCYGTLLAAGIDTEDAAFPSAVAKGLQRR
jgi:hypothetical protein